jgi:hypothetical protein
MADIAELEAEVKRLWNASVSWSIAVNRSERGEMEYETCLVVKERNIKESFKAATYKESMRGAIEKLLRRIRGAT